MVLVGRGLTHKIVNTGPGQLRMLWMISPPGLEDWFRAIGRPRQPGPPPLPSAYSNTKELGRLVYTEYVYPFEIAAVVLLVAIVSAIALTLRRRKQTRYVEPAQQVAVRRQDRVRIVSMPAENKEQG